MTSSSSTFTFAYTSTAPPLSPAGYPQERTVRGCIELPRGRPGPHPALIVAHGYTGFMDWGFFPELSRRLADAGVASLRFNFSGSGIGADRRTMTEPATFRRNSYLHELDDLARIHDRLGAGFWPELDPRRCGILGHSRGGAMALVHASETTNAAALARYRTVIAWAAIDRILNFTPERLDLWRRQGEIDVMHWTARRRLPLDHSVLVAATAHRQRLDVLAACRRLARRACPVLVVMGDADRSVPFAAGENLAAACGDCGELFVVRGGNHTFGAEHPLQDPLPAPCAAVLDRTVDHVLRHVVDATAR